MTSLTHNKIVASSCLFGIVSTLIMPEGVLGLAQEIFHLILELAHFLFEILESYLDHLVEHAFETGTRETQIIVFYIIMSLCCIGLYFLWRTCLQMLLSIKASVLSLQQYYKEQLLQFWSASTGNKFQIIAWFHVVFTLTYLFAF